VGSHELGFVSWAAEAKKGRNHPKKDITGISKAECSAFGICFKNQDIFGDFYCLKPKNKVRTAVQNATSK